MKGSLYNHPRLVWLIFILIILAGYNAFQNMPRLEDTHLVSRVVNITTFYPGADASRVEAELTEKIEQKIMEVAEVKEVMTTSRPNVSVIIVELKDEVDDATPITAKIRDKVSEVTGMPEGAEDPHFNDRRMYAHSAIIALKWISETPINYAILGRHAKELSLRLQMLDGTDFTEITGLSKEEITITLDDDILASHGLTAQEVASRIRQSDARSSAGQVKGNKNSYVIEMDGALDSLERIRRIPLKLDPVGAALRVGDTATVTRGHKNPQEVFAYIDGEYGVTVSARMLENQRIDKWAQKVDAILQDYRTTLPDSIELTQIFDQGFYASERLNGLMKNLAFGALIVVLVLFITLGWRASLISASILPLTLLASLAIVSVMGFRIEQMLVTGLIVALGIMVDNAIVITDEVQHRLLGGASRSAAVAGTVRKLWLPLFGSTLTTIIAFMPLVLMPGNAGNFIGGIPAAVISSLIASYIIAFTVISALGGRFIKRNKSGTDPQKRVWWENGIIGERLASSFRKSLEWSVSNPVKSMVIASILPFSGFYGATQLTDQFFPRSDRNQFRVQIQLPAQASLHETKIAVQKVDQILRQKKSITETSWFAGENIPKFYYSLIPLSDGITSFAESMVTATDQTSIEALMPPLQEELSLAFPNYEILVLELNAGPPISAPLEVRVVGPSFEILNEIGEEVRAIMSRIESVKSTRMSLKTGRPQITIKAREDDVSIAGLTLRQVAEQVRFLTDGIIATQLIEETEQIPVHIISKRSSRDSIDAIRNLNILSSNAAKEADGSFSDLPLDAIADVEMTSKIGSIQRRDGERINTIQGFVEFGVLPGTVFENFKAELSKADIQIPAGYRLEYGGESEKRDEALGNLFATVGFLIVLMVMAIVLTFNSFRMAYITFISAIQSAGLGLFCVWVFNFPFGFLVIIGVMGLIGLAMNATIVILSELKDVDNNMEGDPEAVVQGVMNTGRHIVSTTLTTVGGFLPLIVAGGIFWPPFAISIAGGAFLSMIVSFYFAPAAYMWFAIRNKRKLYKPLYTDGYPQETKS